MIAPDAHLYLSIYEYLSIDGQEYVATGQTDATGHTVYGDIGVYLRDKLNAYLKSDEAPPTLGLGLGLGVTLTLTLTPTPTLTLTLSSGAS